MCLVFKNTLNSFVNMEGCLEIYITFLTRFKMSFDFF